MGKAILLAIAASFCTATSSVCQRLGARQAGPSAGFDIGLIFRLARRPVWLLGIASMIAGFLLQVTALRYGPLALVQPILALELIFVFGYMAAIGSRRVKTRDWLAAVAMSIGLGVFLLLGEPSGVRPRSTAGAWWLAGLVTLGAVLLALAASSGLGRNGRPSPARRAVLVVGVSALSHSHLIVGEHTPSSGPWAMPKAPDRGERTRRLPAGRPSARPRIVEVNPCRNGPTNGQAVSRRC